MHTPSVIKVIAAFLGGLILMMGGGLIYSSTRELMYPVHIARTIPVAEQRSAVEPPQASAKNEEQPLNQSSPVATKRLGSKVIQRCDTASTRASAQRRGIFSELPRPVKSGPKIYLITASYPVPILVPPTQAAKQPETK